jgi:multidrug efflux pump
MIGAVMEGAIKRYRTTAAIATLLTLAGIFSWSAIPVESEPNINVPIFAITVIHEGISPEDGERLILMPLESELRSVEGIEEMRAYAREGQVTTTLEFDVDFPADKARNDVRDALDRAKPKFPLESEEPWISEFTTSDFPIININFAGDDVPERVLYQLAMALRDEIEAIPAVLEANLSGHREELLEAVIEPTLLDSYGITMNEVATSITRNNRLIAAGSLDTGEGRFSVKVPSVIEHATDLFEIPVKTVDGTVVTIADVATIRRTFKDRESYARINGVPAISVEVSKRANANLIDTVHKVREIVERERASYPKSVRVFYTQDQTPHAKAQVTEMEGNIVAALVIVGAAVVAALGLRSGIIVAAAIPLAFLFGLIVVYLMGFTFNFMVMFGLLLGLGMIVDGSIVVTEYADRKMAEGMPRIEAYSVAARRMFPPVFASIATTLAAFLPLMFWPGIAGKFMAFLPVTVFAVLVGSLIYAMFFGPVFGAYFGKAHVQSEQDKRDVYNLEQGDPRQISGFTGWYARLVDKLTSWPILTMTATVAIIAAVFWAYGQFGKGTTFFTDADPQFAQVYIRARGNLSAAERHDLMAEVEREALQVPGIEYMDSRSTVLSSSGGGGMGGNSAPTDMIGQIFIQLHEQRYRTMTGREILEEIRQRTAHLAGIEVNVQAEQQGPPTGKDIQAEFSSRQWALVEPTLRRIRDHMESMDGIRDVDDTLSLPGVEWKFTVDRAKAAALGADVTSVGQAVQLVTNGIKVAEYRPDDSKDEVDIRVRYPTAERGIEALQMLKVPTLQGNVPASSFVTLSPTPRTDTIERVDGRRVLHLRANVAPGVLPDAKVKELQSWIDAQGFDPLVDIKFRGANEEQNETLGFVFQAFVLALLLMFIMMIAQFNSFYQAMLILVSIVMSTAGVLLGLLITDEPFSAILTGIGVVALAGIIVHNNIVLIDTYNQLRRDMPHETIHETIVRTGAQRLRPVFLTVIVCVLGLVPMALHLSIDLINREVIYGGTVTAFWVPLTRSICFGLTFATILTLIVTPSMLSLPLRLRNIVRSMLGRPIETGAQVPVPEHVVPSPVGEPATVVAVARDPATPVRRVS